MVHPQPRHPSFPSFNQAPNIRQFCLSKILFPLRLDGEGPLTCLDEESPISLPALLHGVLAVCLLGGVRENLELLAQDRGT